MSDAKPRDPYPRAWELVKDVYTAPNGAKASQNLMRLRVPAGWLVTRPGVYTLCFIPDPEHAWELEEL